MYGSDQSASLEMKLELIGSVRKVGSTIGTDKLGDIWKMKFQLLKN